MNNRLGGKCNRLLLAQLKGSKKMLQYRCKRKASDAIAGLPWKGSRQRQDSLINVDPLNTQVPKTQQELSSILKKNIVFQKGGLLVIAKPPSVPVSGASSKGVSVSGSILQLIKSCNLPMLEIIKAAEKESSGMLLMATNYDKLSEFKNNWQSLGANLSMQRKFLAVTIGIPEPETGTICQALKTVSVEDNHLTVPVREFSLRSIKGGLVKKATTQYRVLSKNERLHCALVELTVEKLRHHQLQVHLGHKMCRVLGDHLYSSRVRSILGMNVTASPDNIAPQTQEIPSGIKQCLGLTKTRHQEMVPLHLHWYQTRMPGIQQIIECPILPYFRWTLKQLGLASANEVT